MHYFDIGYNQGRDCTCKGLITPKPTLAPTPSPTVVNGTDPDADVVNPIGAMASTGTIALASFSYASDDKKKDDNGGDRDLMFHGAQYLQVRGWTGATTQTTAKTIVCS